jgi:addiction module RelE/StbE family toxin
MKAYWTRESLTRLREIDEYISRDNPKAAAEFVNNLISIAETIPVNPEKGRIVPEISIKEIRELVYKNYRIVYLIKKSRIEILTVFEGIGYLKEKK